MTSTPSLSQLGWRSFFEEQISAEEMTDYCIARVIEQHRGTVVTLSEQGQDTLLHSAKAERVCVGDWILFDNEQKIYRILERETLFQRKAPGAKVEIQHIASNVDKLFIVTSLNEDFNLNRIERYMALSREAEVEPVVILTKTDQCEDTEAKRKQVQALDPFMMVHALNAKDPEQVIELAHYCEEGKTLAMLGSSGVGKSTLMNGFMGFEAQETGGIREDDGKGRHTTRYRSLKLLPNGGLLMDTPGIRELQLSGCEQGVNDAFAEIADFAQQCRFNDCSHTNEPGCEVQKALKDGRLSERRLKSYNKLMTEQEINNATLYEKREKERAFSKFINKAKKQAHARKPRY